MQHPKDPNQTDTGRLFIAIGLSLFILGLFYQFVEKPRIDAMKKQQELRLAQMEGTIENSIPEIVEVRDRSVVLSESLQRLEFDTPSVHGSINLIGGRIDDLVLKGHKKTLEGDEFVSLLAPVGSPEPYYVEAGWVSKSKNADLLPNAQTHWSVVGGQTVLKENQPVTLQWDNGKGLVFEREITLDENYLFSITQRVTNNSANDVSVNAYQLISRHGIPADLVDFFILHEGPQGFLEDKWHDINYSDLRDDKLLEFNARDGWVGIGDKYWFVGLIPSAKQDVSARFVYTGNNEKNEKFQTDLTGQPQIVAAGNRVENTFRLYAGAKKLSVINAYVKMDGLETLDQMFDYGMWYFITKPLLFVLNWLTAFFGHVGWAILFLTVCLRLAMYPLTNKQFRSMAKMKQIAPQLKKLQEKHKDNRELLQKEIFKLYQKEQVNPFSGCLPILVQIPIFFALYKVIMLDLDMRHAPFWGWIDDMSSQDPTSLFNLFGLIPWDPPSFLLIGLWPCLMGITMVMQRRLSPPPPDKTQAKMMLYMPYFFTFLMAKFAAGLVIYWTWSNLIGLLQQYVIMRRMGVNVSLIRGHGERRKNKADEEASETKETDVSKVKKSKT